MDPQNSPKVPKVDNVYVYIYIIIFIIFIYSSCFIYLFFLIYVLLFFHVRNSSQIYQHRHTIAICKVYQYNMPLQTTSVGGLFVPGRGRSAVGPGGSPLPDTDGPHPLGFHLHVGGSGSSAEHGSGERFTKGGTLGFPSST